jgi:hypothetical protein
MRLTRAAICFCLCLPIAPVRGAADELLDQLATCRVSWLDFKNDPEQAKKFADAIQSGFVQKPRSPAWTPKKSVTVVGLPVVEIFPESVGMGVGFSVTVEANFDKARAHLEKAAGKTLKDCESDEGMRSCGLEIGDKRTLMLMAGENGKSKTSLLGCYYFYAR